MMLIPYTEIVVPVKASVLVVNRGVDLEKRSGSGNCDDDGQDTIKVS